LDDPGMLRYPDKENVPLMLAPFLLDSCLHQLVEADEQFSGEDPRAEQAVPDDQGVTPPPFVADEVVEHGPLAKVTVDQRPPAGPRPGRDHRAQLSECRRPQV